MQRLSSRMSEFWIQTDQCTVQSKCVGILWVEWSIIDLCFRLLYKHREDGKDGENLWSATLSYVLSNGVQCYFGHCIDSKINKLMSVGFVIWIKASDWVLHGALCSEMDQDLQRFLILYTTFTGLDSLMKTLWNSNRKKKSGMIISRKFLRWYTVKLHNERLILNALILVMQNALKLHQKEGCDSCNNLSVYVYVYLYCFSFIYSTLSTDL